MPIVLIGVPGAGKTTVGQILADKLQMPFIDSDQVIEQESGKSISDIFVQDGESHFRLLEKNTIAKAMHNPEIVLSIGGGALLDADTRELVKQNVCIWLQAGLSQAVDRVGMNRNRPLLLGNIRGQLADLMTAREPLYLECAKHAVDTNNMTPDQVADKIIQILGK